MRILATGFNAHGQLHDSRTDLFKFTEVASDVHDLKCSTWSTLTWSNTSGLKTQGHQRFESSFNNIEHIHSLAGDHNGVLGLIYDSQLYASSMADDTDGNILLQNGSTASSPRLSKLAVANNGRTVILQGADDGNTIVVSEFDTFEALRAWYADPARSDAQPAAQHTITGSAQQLVAGATSFALLTSDGEVYTWGEARRCSLGRSATDTDGKSIAHVPGIVPGLLGIRITKICHGGWMFGAVSEDGAGYIWGLSMPRYKDHITDIAELSEDSDIALIQLSNTIEDEPDVIDMDVGEGHAALVTSGGELYVVGINSNGQLAQDANAKAVAQWTLVPEVDRAVKVVCGPKSTAVLTQ